MAENTATLFRNVAKQCERFTAYSSHNHQSVTRLIVIMKVTVRWIEVTTTGNDTHSVRMSVPAFAVLEHRISNTSKQ